jgi:hypothetical protein
VGTLHESLRARTGDEAGSAPPRQTPPTAGDSAAAGIVDPMQWWGALTQQFTDLAASAMQDALKDGDKMRAKPTPTGAGTPKTPAGHDDEAAPRRPATAAQAAAAPDTKVAERAARRRERSNGPAAR